MTLPDSEPVGDTIIIDGSALINCKPPRSSKTFNEYAKEVIVPKAESFGTKYERVDIVFDEYKKSNLKPDQKEVRGSEEESDWK